MIVYQLGVITIMEFMWKGQNGIEKIASANQKDLIGKTENMPNELRK